jgi:transcriptional regulator with XRE-family HTH domain
VEITGIRAARKARGLSLRELGREAGLQGDLISSYEVGRRPLHKKDSVKIARAMKMKKGDDLQLRIDSATRGFERAQDAEDAQGAIKHAGRLIELAEEADKDGTYTVDWTALEDLVDSLSRQISGLEVDPEDEEDPDDDEDESPETDDKKKRLKRPASKKARGDADYDDDDMDRDPFGCRLHRRSDTEDDDVDEDGLNVRDAVGRRVRKD